MDRVPAVNIRGVIMNKKRLVLAGILSVLCANGLTVHADSTVSTNSENLLVNRSTNADGSTNYEISMTNYPTYQGTFIGSGGDINHGIRIESDGISISDTVEENAGHPDDRHSRIGAGYFDMYNGTHELVWLEDYGLAILDRKENKYMAQMEPKTFTMSNVQSGDKSELSTDGTKIVHYDNENSTEYNTNYGYNGVTITTTDGDHDNEKTVSLTNKGLDNGNNKIVNVSKGEVSKTSTDAINGSQLHEVKTQVDNNTNRISTLENNTVNIGDKVLNNAKSYTDRQVSKVGAASAALAGLHYLDYNPNDKWSLPLAWATINTPPLVLSVRPISQTKTPWFTLALPLVVKACLTSVLLSKWANKIRHSKQAALKWRNKSKTYKPIMHHCVQTTKNYGLK